jgi:pyruvate/2-oxoglutarate dehydrogenase complex dihydrolipoamide dehydrogenase (E3) component
MERIQGVIRKVAPHDSVERYTRLGVDCIHGTARIVSPFAVAVGDRELTTRSIVVATGARPFVPPIQGLDRVPYLTSDNLWDLRALPRRLVVLGGGPIGCELAQAFARLGSAVTQVEMMPRILGREDPDVSALIQARFEAEGIRVLTGHRAQSVTVVNGENRLICRSNGSEVVVAFDEILVAVGRVPNTEGVGLEALGVRLSKNDVVETDAFLRTNFPNIYCAGDVVGSYQFTHTAAHQAWFASVNALFGRFKSFRVDNRVIPWATFTDPEVARVGLNVQEANEGGIDVEETRYGLNELDRAIADGDDHGFVRVLTRPGSDRILGVTIVGPHAGDIITEYILAMRQGLGLNKILTTIHIYPTLAEANKHAAGQWRKAHVSQGLLRWLARYHRWRRG